MFSAAAAAPTSVGHTDYFNHPNEQTMSQLGQMKRWARSELTCTCFARSRERACVRHTVAVGCHTRMHLRLFAVKCWAASQGWWKQPAIQQKQEPTTEKSGTFLLIIVSERSDILNVTLSLSQGHHSVQKRGLNNLNSSLKVLEAVPHSGSFGFICPVSDTEEEQIEMFI